MSNQEITPQKSAAGPQPRVGHKNKGCAVTCGLLLIGGIVATIIGAYSMFFAFNRAISQYLSPQRKTFAASPLSAEATAAAKARALAFMDALNHGQSPPELVLTADEVNALLDAFAAENKIEIPARVSFDNDRIHAELSVPLRGLYLNGSGELSVGLSDGVLLVYANSLEINGKAPPETLMELSRKHNLAGPFMDEPDVRQFLKELKYVTVTGGKLKITPKAANEKQ